MISHGSSPWRGSNPAGAGLCTSGIDKPIGVAEDQLVHALPEPLEGKLPSLEEI